MASAVNNNLLKMTSEEEKSVSSRWKLISMWKNTVKVFHSISKYPRYGRYEFTATINSDALSDPIWNNLSDFDILCLVDDGPYFFGGGISSKVFDSKGNLVIEGYVYTD